MMFEKIIKIHEGSSHDKDKDKIAEKRNFES